MTANELIKTLQSYDEDLTVQFDFGGYPQYIDSWRGSYDQPSLFWDMKYTRITIKGFIDMLMKVEGMKVEGYKGGDFMLSANDEIYLSYSYGDYIQCVIERISKEDSTLILHTKYQSY